MKIAIAKEIDSAEPRVAAVPDTVKKFKALGADVAIEPGAGIKSGVPDAEYQAAGATVAADAVKDADIVIKVKRPEASELANYKRGALVIAIMDPYGVGRRHQALFGAAAAVRARRQGSHLLGRRPFGDRGHDFRIGGYGVARSTD